MRGCCCSVSSRGDTGGDACSLVSLSRRTFAVTAHIVIMASIPATTNIIFFLLNWKKCTGVWAWSHLLLYSLSWRRLCILRERMTGFRKKSEAGRHVRLRVHAIALAGRRRRSCRLGRRERVQVFDDRFVWTSILLLYEMTINMKEHESSKTDASHCARRARVNSHPSP